MKDLCHATLYIRTSSNPTGGILIKFFHIKILGVVFFMCFLLLFFFVCVVCLFFVLIFLCVFYIVFLGCVFFFFLLKLFIIFNLNFNRNRQNIMTMKFQDVSCPPLAESVLSSSVEPPSQSLAVSVSSSLDVTAMTRRSTWSSTAMSVT